MAISDIMIANLVLACIYTPCFLLNFCYCLYVTHKVRISVILNEVEY